MPKKRLTPAHFRNRLEAVNKLMFGERYLTLEKYTEQYSVVMRLNKVIVKVVVHGPLRECFAETEQFIKDYKEPENAIT